MPISFSPEDAFRSEGWRPLAVVLCRWIIRPLMLIGSAPAIVNLRSENSSRQLLLLLLHVCYSTDDRTASAVTHLPLTSRNASCRMLHARERYDKWLPYVISDSSLSPSLFLTTCLVDLSLNPRQR